jgi:hypothetical protein
MRQSLITNWTRDSPEKCFVKEFARLDIRSKEFYDINPVKTPFTVIFKHDYIEPVYFKCEDKYALYATQDLYVGTLVLIERAFVKKRKSMLIALSVYPEILEKLYPRTGQRPEANPLELLWDKVDKNVFQWEDQGDPKHLKDTLALLPFLSMSNHSCNPNIDIVRWLDSDFQDRPEDNFLNGGYAVYTTQPVKKGEELCISYGVEVGHTPTQNSQCVHSWTCRCGMDEEERRIKFDASNKLAFECWEEDKHTLGYLFNED